MKYLFTLLSIFCLANLSIAQSGETLFDTDMVHEIRITFAEDNFWQILSNNYFSNQENSGSSIPYLMGTVEIDGNIVDSVGVRQKGFSSHFFTESEKKSLKLDFNEFVMGQKYEGLRKVNLNNGVGDPALQRDFLCYDMIRKAGGVAPRVAYSNIYLNDEYWGIYVLVEQIDRTFLDENFANGNGNLFKNISWSDLEYLGGNPNAYKDIFELKTNEDIDDWTRFIEFMDLINNSTAAEFEAEIQDYFNVDAYLRVLAIDVMSNNWDSYIEHGRNWYLYQDSSSNQFQWLPWDYNLAMGGNFGIFEEPNVATEDTSTCGLRLDFLFSRDGLSLTFEDNLGDAGVNWFWSFGDGSISTERNPVHAFATATQFEVCLTLDFVMDEVNCTKDICKTINLSFDPNDCPTVLNGSSPYDSSDPIFIQVIENDEFCCELGWDATCQNQYNAIESGSAGGNGGGGNGQYIFSNFDLLLNTSDKVLVNKILAVPHFRERYLNICCEIVEHNFTVERLIPIIEDNVDLIRDAVYEDDNYVFSTNYFEYDAYNEFGNGGVSIAPIKYFVTERSLSVRANLTELAHDCDLQFSSIAWQDVVVNEFMASNAADGGVADPSGAYPDWIEIYNNTTETIDLGAMYLTDDAADLQKWRFDLGTFLAPDSYLIVWADNDLEEEGIHSNFKLSKAGESIYLSHEDGTVIDSLSYGEQQTNVASARLPNGTGDFVMQHATFSSNNSDPLATFHPEVAAAIQVYPNPARSSFLVDLKELDSQQEVTIFIKNALGQLVHTVQKTRSTMVEISTTDFGTGLFTVQLVFDDKSSVAKKILVLRN